MKLRTILMCTAFLFAVTTAFAMKTSKRYPATVSYQLSVCINSSFQLDVDPTCSLAGTGAQCTFGAIAPGIPYFKAGHPVSGAGGCTYPYRKMF